jgi:hypothetical protein
VERVDQNAEVGAINAKRKHEYDQSCKVLIVAIVSDLLAGGICSLVYLLCSAIMLLVKRSVCKSVRGGTKDGLRGLEGCM